MEQIYYNGRIYTMKGEQEVQALYIKDGLIHDIGSDEYILKTYPNVDKTDLNKQCVIPGINDSHMHLISPVSIELFDARSINDVVEMTNLQVSPDLEDNEWIVGRGYNHDYFDVKEMPKKEDLDKISTTHPVCLIRACGHIGAVNSKALEMLNVTKDSQPHIDGGFFNTDENGEPNGIVTEFALDYVKSFFNKPSVNRIKETIVNKTNRLLSEGITSIQTDDFMSFTNVDFTEIIQAYEELVKENNLNVRIYQQSQLPELETLQRFLDLGYKTGYGDDFFRIGPLKLLLDGALGARTAWMSKPYADEPTTKGMATYDMPVFNQLIETGHNGGMQIAVHAIGDQSIKQVTQSYIDVQNKNMRNDARHGIVHVQISELSDIERMANHRILAYIQPIFVHYDQHIADDRVGKQLASTSYAWKTMRDLGVVAPFGTDSPVEPTNPYNCMYCAITRKDLSGTQDKGWNEQECVSRWEALDSYTSVSAFASFDENKKGKLLPGMFADFVVLSDNYFEIDVEKIKDLTAVTTVVNGQVKYQK